MKYPSDFIGNLRDSETLIHQTDKKLMATGTVKWFNDSKGFGFITPGTGDTDVFIHFSAIAMEGYKSLKQGARVNFEQTDDPKGLHAQNIVQITLLEDSNTAARQRKREVAFPFSC